MSNNKKVKDEQKLSQRRDYKKAIEFVEKFVQQQKVTKEKQIKINPYGDSPWIQHPMTSLKEWNSSI